MSSELIHSRTETPCFDNLPQEIVDKILHYALPGRPQTIFLQLDLNAKRFYSSWAPPNLLFINKTCRKFCQKFFTVVFDLGQAGFPAHVNCPAYLNCFNEVLVTQLEFRNLLDSAYMKGHVRTYDRRCYARIWKFHRTWSLSLSSHQKSANQYSAREKAEFSCLDPRSEGVQPSAAPITFDDAMSALLNAPYHDRSSAMMEYVLCTN